MGRGDMETIADFGQGSHMGVAVSKEGSSWNLP